MHQFISMMKPGRPELQKDFFGHLTPAEQTAFEQHSDFLQSKFKEGTVIFAGPSVAADEDHFAVVVLNAEDKAHAQAVMNADPAVAAGILTSHVTEFFVYLSREFKESE